MKPPITIYGGKKEIGGNKVLLEGRDAKLWLDFGVGYASRSKYFEEFVNPRPANRIGDFIEMGLAPNLKGLYREDLIGRREEVEYDGVFISHAHMDHCAYVSFLNPEIPVYMSEVTKLVLEAVKEAGKRDIELEILAFKERPIKKGAEEIERDIRIFKSGKRKRIGEFEVTPVNVDHSVPGAHGFVVDGPEGRVVYSGDLRMHGRGREKTEEFVEKAEGADVLVLEGTRVEEKRSRLEEDVERDVVKWVKEHSGLVLVDFNFKDVDRLKTFLKASEESDRIFVIPFKEAVLVKHLSKKLKIPSLDNFVLFKPKRRSGMFEERDYRGVEKEYYEKYESWTYKDVMENEKKVMLFLSYYAFPNLIDLKPKNALFIHSLSEAFNEEMEISKRRMMNWLKHFGIEYRHSHCSGHASGSELRDIAKGINPKRVIPIHTEHPRKLTRLVK
ncbi:MAG: MBL fold metallo-hydrolase [Candidatus Diapherotrites archaeon]|nr:MBL fold metallo-hydrolase [Candidatus Diapherotrites archaeon]